MKTDCFAYQKNLQEKKAKKEYLAKQKRDKKWMIAADRRFTQWVRGVK